MSFLSLEWSAAFFLIPLLMFLLVWGRRARNRDMEQLVSQQRRADQWLESHHDLLRTPILFTLAAVALVFALMRPSWGRELQIYETTASEIVLAVDTSASMLAQDVSPNRLERAKRKIVDLIDRADNDRIALVSFAGTAFLQTPLTEDARALELFVDQIDTTLIPVPGSRFDRAIEVARDALGRSSQDPERQASSDSQAIVLLTDGENAPATAIEAARRARSEGVRVFVLGIGTPDGAPIPLDSGFKKDQNNQVIISKLDQLALAQIAEAGGGRYVGSVSSDADLLELYDRGIKRELQSGVSGMERKELPIERFQWPLLLAFVIFLLELSFQFGPRALKGRRPNRAKAGHARRALCLSLLIPAQLAAHPEAAHAQALSPDPSAGDFLHLKAREAKQALEKGDFETAIQLYKSRIAAQGPGEQVAEDYYNLGNALYGQGDYSGASQALQQASRLYQRPLALEESNAGGNDHPADSDKLADALHNLGNAEFMGGDLEKAIAAYQEALLHRPNDAGTQANLQQAQVLLEQQKQQEQQEQQSGESNQQQQSNSNSPTQNQTQGHEQATQDRESADQNVQENDNQADDSPAPDREEEASQNPLSEDVKNSERQGEEAEEEGAASQAEADGEKKEQLPDTPGAREEASSTKQDSATEERSAELSAQQMQEIFEQIREQPRRYLEYKARQAAQEQLEEGGSTQGGQDW